MKKAKGEKVHKIRLDQTQTEKEKIKCKAKPLDPHKQQIQ